MPLGDYGKDAILDEFFGSGSPTNWYLALSSTEPNPDGTNITELDNDYERLEIDNTGTEWDAATNQIKTNLVAFEWDEPTDDWGTARWFAIMTADTGGDMFAYGQIVPERFISEGVIPKFNPGELVIRYETPE